MKTQGSGTTIGAALGTLALVLTGVAGTAPAAYGGEPAARYVLEFRSRPNDYFGHSYVVARAIDSSGRTTRAHVAGFNPRTSDPLATLRGTPGKVGAWREDYTAPIEARFAVRVSRAQFDNAVGKIAANARRQPTYHLTEQNCNTFVGRVARAAGLRAPSRDAQLPRRYIRELQALNGRG